MTDRADLAALRNWVQEFAMTRGWDQLRTLKDLSMAIGIEAAELQEIFLWEPVAEEDALLARDRPRIEEELADVFIYTLAMADRIDSDLVEIALRKMAANEGRFPKLD